MKLWFIFHKTALHLAIEKQNTEIVKLLLENEKLDINHLYIQNCQYFILFKNSLFKWCLEWKFFHKI